MSNPRILEISESEFLEDVAESLRIGRVEDKVLRVTVGAYLRQILHKRDYEQLDKNGLSVRLIHTSLFHKFPKEFLYDLYNTVVVHTSNGCIVCALLETGADALR